MLPNFLIIGAARSGTSTLYYQLQKHPQIYLPKSKRPEPHFFFKISEYEKGLSYYEKKHFSGWDGQKMVGEASTSYLFGSKTPELIAKALPNIQLITILRNPIERAYSNYLHSVASGIEKLDFAEAILCEEKRTNEIVGTQLDEIKPFSYLARGLYWKQIENWLNFFDRSQFHFIIFDDFIVNQKATIFRLLDFLDLPYNEFDVDETCIENKSFVQGSYISDSSRELMINFFRNDIEKLGFFFGRDLKSWLS